MDLEPPPCAIGQRNPLIALKHFFSGSSIDLGADCISLYLYIIQLFHYSANLNTNSLNTLLIFSFGLFSYGLPPALVKNFTVPIPMRRGMGFGQSAHKPPKGVSPSFKSSDIYFSNVDFSRRSGETADFFRLPNTNLSRKTNKFSLHIWPGICYNVDK